MREIFHFLKGVMPYPFAVFLTLFLELWKAFILTALLGLAPVSLIVWWRTRPYRLTRFDFLVFRLVVRQLYWDYLSRFFRSREVAEVVTVATFVVVYLGMFVWFVFHDFYPADQYKIVLLYLGVVAVGLCIVGLPFVSLIIYQWINRRFPNFVPRIRQALKVLKFLLWGWTRTTWGLRLLVTGGAVLWFKILAPRHGIAEAVAIIVPSLVALYVLGKALARLYRTFAERGWSRSEKILKETVSVAMMIIMLACVGANVTRDDQSLRPAFIGFLAALTIFATVALGRGAPTQPRGRKYGDAEVVSEDILKAKGVIDER
jgi:hypothetical protein